MSYRVQSYRVQNDNRFLANYLPLQHMLRGKSASRLSSNPGVIWSWHKIS